jgi:uncharacterized integral membrane protein
MADEQHEPGMEGVQAAPGPAGPSAVARFRQGAVRGVGIAAIALFTAFALANRQAVDFSWLFGATEVTEVAGERVGGGVPLILLLVVAFLLGIVVGTTGTLLRARSRRRAARGR